MPVVHFAQLPDHARLWIFAASRPLEGTAKDQLLSLVDGFLAEWKAHGVPLTTARDWRHQRFLLVAVDEQAAGVSGCSIDALVRCLKGAERDLEVTLTDTAAVLFRGDDGVHHVSRDAFRDLVRSGRVHPKTLVFDNTIQTVGALRAGRWELPAAESWHARAFFQRAETVPSSSS